LPAIKRLFAGSWFFVLQTYIKLHVRMTETFRDLSGDAQRQFAGCHSDFAVGSADRVWQPYRCESSATPTRPAHVAAAVGCNVASQYTPLLPSAGWRRKVFIDLAAELEI
jgi:hypothetical protein